MAWGPRGEPEQATITLYPTRNLFMPAALGAGRRRVAANNTVFHERGRESRVVLPIVPVAALAHWAPARR
jgi:hypothetical protein